jgi:hypothetical protein
MKKTLMVGLALLAAVPALAGPKDQSKQPMIGPQSVAGNATVNNTTTAISIKSKGCTLQAGFKGLAGTADGDVIVCIADADVIAPPTINAPGGGNGVILVGETKAGGMKIKADLTEIGCGSTASINFNGNLRCYLDDPAFRAPGGTWQAACTVNPGSAPIPNPSMDPGQLKVNAGQNVVVGLCQNFTTVGARVSPPASTLIAVQGSYTGVVAP